MKRSKTVNIHQIYFDPEQLRGLDPAFIPFDNCDNPNPELREYYVFNKMYEQGAYKSADLTGYLSWKFQDKTGITGAEFVQYIHKKPGYDVYFINPMVENLRYKNVWVQGEDCHPHITRLANKIINAAGYDIDVNELKMSRKNTLYCNYWVGSQAFWQQFIPFLQKCHDAIYTHLGDEDRTLLFKRADPVIDANYFPFIFERLFSTFLVLNPDIKSKSFSYPPKVHKGRFLMQLFSHQKWILTVSRKFNLKHQWRVFKHFLRAQYNIRARRLDFHLMHLKLRLKYGIKRDEDDAG
ncbi:MAG: hypothetical protein P1U40_13030 [Coxiellaceae bacterium]|nr:hypothetical protein [Coxiellaceae bacterium]